MPKKKENNTEARIEKDKQKSAEKVNVQETFTPSEEEVEEPDIVDYGEQEDVVVVPNTTKAFLKKTGVELKSDGIYNPWPDQPLVKIVCLTDIDSAPVVGKFRFKDSFDFKSGSQATVPLNVGNFLEEKKVAAIIQRG